MGIKNYLIEGGSGVGKTTVAEELERRGYYVVHGDRNFAYYGDPETGEPVDGPPDRSTPESLARWYGLWIWPVDKVKALIADRSHPVTFFCGSSRNARHFIDLFDRVFVLEVDLKTLMERLARRPDDEFGGRPIEQELIARRHAAKADTPPNAVSIDATRPVARVVDAILAKCGESAWTPPSGPNRLTPPLRRPRPS